VSREESAASLLAAGRFLADRPGFGMTKGRFLRKLSHYQTLSIWLVLVPRSSGVRMHVRYRAEAANLSSYDARIGPFRFANQETADGFSQALIFGSRRRL